MGMLDVHTLRWLSLLGVRWKAMTERNEDETDVPRRRLWHGTWRTLSGSGPQDGDITLDLGVAPDSTDEAATVAAETDGRYLVGDLLRLLGLHDELTLNLGLARDDPLGATNDFTVFMEEFERLHLPDED